jgi:hypothetical protein
MNKLFLLLTCITIHASLHGAQVYIKRIGTYKTTLIAHRAVTTQVNGKAEEDGDAYGYSRSCCNIACFDGTDETYEAAFRTIIYYDSIMEKIARYGYTGSQGKSCLDCKTLSPEHAEVVYNCLRSEWDEVKKKLADRKNKSDTKDQFHSEDNKKNTEK